MSTLKIKLNNDQIRKILIHLFPEHAGYNVIGTTTGRMSGKEASALVNKALKNMKKKKEKL